MKATTERLIPQHHDEFSSKQYWDKFFRERGNEAFEWYGTWLDLRKITAYTKTTDRTLVIGCGNSDFSTHYYQAGYKNITNLDFSTLVIDEMKTKTEKLCPGMEWLLGDMTKLPESCVTSSFNTVFDKGALDALLSTNTESLLSQATSMFHEIDRVLVPGGKYLCITLAEDYILSSLLSFFAVTMQNKYSVSIELIETAKKSPLKPFLVVVSKNESSSNPSSTSSSLPNESISLYFDAMGNHIISPSIVSVSTAKSVVQTLQREKLRHVDRGTVQIGRFETIELWQEKKSTTSTSANSKSAIEAHQNITSTPRFTILLVDASLSAPLSCAVFFIPAGREAEWQFTTQEGLLEIATQANCRRLLAVRCNRPHTFPPNRSKELQQELNPYMIDLQPTDTRPDERIPYMELGADQEWEKIGMGELAMSGAYYIEEGPDDDVKEAIRRRLVFLQNQNFIQTEIRMKGMVSGGGGGKGGKGGGGGGKKKASSSNKKDKTKDRNADIIEGLEVDLTYLDSHHKCVLAGIAFCPLLIRKGSKISHGTDSSRTYSGLDDLIKGHNLVPKDAHDACKACPEGGRCLVIGLGGGAFPMVLQRYLPAMNLYVCDLDPELLPLAQNYFGFKAKARTTVFEGEGMHVLQALKQRMDNMKTSTSMLPPSPPSEGDSIKASSSTSTGEAGDAETSQHPLGNEPFDLLFIDCDSKDSSLGMTAPPPAFTSNESLSLFHSLLVPGGILAINVVARSRSLLSEFVERVRSVWEDGVGGSVMVMKDSDETVNVVVLAVRGWGAGRESGQRQKEEAKVSPSRQRILEEWLTLIGMSSDPLQLNEVLGKATIVSSAISVDELGKQVSLKTKI